MRHHRENFFENPNSSYMLSNRIKENNVTIPDLIYGGSSRELGWFGAFSRKYKKETGKKPNVKFDEFERKTEKLDKYDYNKIKKIIFNEKTVRKTVKKSDKNIYDKQLDVCDRRTDKLIEMMGSQLGNKRMDKLIDILADQLTGKRRKVVEEYEEVPRRKEEPIVSHNRDPEISSIDKNLREREKERKPQQSKKTDGVPSVADSILEAFEGISPSEETLSVADLLKKRGQTGKFKISRKTKEEPINIDVPIPPPPPPMGESMYYMTGGNLPNQYLYKYDLYSHMNHNLPVHQLQQSEMEWLPLTDLSYSTEYDYRGSNTPQLGSVHINQAPLVLNGEIYNYTAGCSTCGFN